MIVVKVPMRISFMGGGTDLPGFFHKSEGRVLSATINKYVVLVINPTPMTNKISIRYSVSETVDSPEQIQNTRVRAAFLDLGIKSNIEVGSFASIPAKIGLGSSSSFSVALIMGLYDYLGKIMTKSDIAEAACRLEIELVKEPIGKQDQYAATFGGFNVFTFNPDDSVNVEPIIMDFQKRNEIEKHAILFFTGLKREASDILTVQRAKIDEKFETYKLIAGSVYDFKKKLLAGNVKAMAEMLHEGWLRKKILAPGISSSIIDSLYETGLKEGAWGGKILGAGGGGCLLLLAPPEKHDAILASLKELCFKEKLFEARRIPFGFVQAGADVIFNSGRDSLA